jgi:hypothetical protein
MCQRRPEQRPRWMCSSQTGILPRTASVDWGGDCSYERSNGGSRVRDRFHHFTKCRSYVFAVCVVLVLDSQGLKRRVQALGFVAVQAVEAAKVTSAPLVSETVNDKEVRAWTRLRLRVSGTRHDDWIQSLGICHTGPSRDEGFGKRVLVEKWPEAAAGQQCMLH